MKIYIDSDCKCHVEAAEGLREIETDAFDGKCPACIEGSRYVPPGETWTRKDGEVFEGEMISPWKDSAVLAAYQKQYETDLAEQADMRTALETLGVTVDG